MASTDQAAPAGCPQPAAGLLDEGADQEAADVPDDCRETPCRQSPEGVLLQARPSVSFLHKGIRVRDAAKNMELNVYRSPAPPPRPPPETLTPQPPTQEQHFLSWPQPQSAAEAAGAPEAPAAADDARGDEPTGPADAAAGAPASGEPPSGAGSESRSPGRPAQRSRELGDPPRAAAAEPAFEDSPTPASGQGQARQPSSQRDSCALGPEFEVRGAAADAEEASTATPPTPGLPDALDATVGAGDPQAAAADAAAEAEPDTEGGPASADSPSAAEVEAAAPGEDDEPGPPGGLAAEAPDARAAVEGGEEDAQPEPPGGLAAEAPDAQAAVEGEEEDAEEDPEGPRPAGREWPSGLGAASGSREPRKSDESAAAFACAGLAEEAGAAAAEALAPAPAEEAAEATAQASGEAPAPAATAAAELPVAAPVAGWHESLAAAEAEPTAEAGGEMALAAAAAELPVAAAAPGSHERLVAAGTEAAADTVGEAALAPAPTAVELPIAAAAPDWHERLATADAELAAGAGGEATLAPEATVAELPVVAATPGSRDWAAAADAEPTECLPSTDEPGRAPAAEAPAAQVTSAKEEEEEEQEEEEADRPRQPLSAERLASLERADREGEVAQQQVTSAEEEEEQQQEEEADRPRQPLSAERLASLERADREGDIAQQQVTSAEEEEQEQEEEAERPRQPLSAERLAGLERADHEGDAAQQQVASAAAASGSREPPRGAAGGLAGDHRPFVQRCLSESAVPPPSRPEGARPLVHGTLDLSWLQDRLQPAPRQASAESAAAGRGGLAPGEERRATRGAAHQPQAGQERRATREEPGEERRATRGAAHQPQAGQERRWDFGGSFGSQQHARRQGATSPAGPHLRPPAGAVSLSLSPVRPSMEEPDLAALSASELQRQEKLSSVISGGGDGAGDSCASTSAEATGDEVAVSSGEANSQSAFLAACSCEQVPGSRLLAEALKQGAREGAPQASVAELSADRTFKSIMQDLASVSDRLTKVFPDEQREGEVRRVEGGLLGESFRKLHHQSAEATKEERGANVSMCSQGRGWEERGAQRHSSSSSGKGGATPILSPVREPPAGAAALVGLTACLSRPKSVPLKGVGLQQEALPDPESAPGDWLSRSVPGGRTQWHHRSLGPAPWEAAERERPRPAATYPNVFMYSQARGWEDAQAPLTPRATVMVLPGSNEQVGTVCRRARAKAHAARSSVG